MADKIKCPKCDMEREIGENFCGNCCCPLPGGKTTCPYCNKEIDASARFCTKCGAELGEGKPFDFSSKRWQRGPTDFAIRVDNVDLKGVFKKDIIIDPGTKALFFQDGKFCAELSAGYYKLEGFFKKIERFLNISIPAGIVIVDAVDVELQMSVDELFTKEEQTVGVKMRMMFQLEKPELFFVNLLKGKDKYSRQELESFLMIEVKNVLQQALKSKSIQELYGNLELKKSLEQSIESEMRTTLERTGLRVVQLRVIDFCGSAYDELRKAMGDLYIDSRWIDAEEARGQLNERMRQVLTKEKMDEFRSGIDLENFIREQQKELGLKDIIHKEEIKELGRIFDENRDRKELAHSQLLDRLAHEYDLVKERKEKIAKGEMSIIDAEDKVKGKRIEFDEELRQDREDWKLADEIKKDKIEQRKKELEILSQASIQALIAESKDDEVREHLLKLQQIGQEEKMTPEQILARAAKDSPEAAEAIGKKFAAQGMFNEQRVKELQKTIDDIQKRDGEWADRLKEVMNTSLAQMGRTAESAARGWGGQTIVTGPGSQTIAAGGGRGTVEGKICQKCGTQARPGEKFCPKCGYEF